MTNPTQQLLDRASAERAYHAEVDVLDVRQRVRPLERRRLHRLAAFIALTPICRRAS
jgi:hypothetical protein